MLSSKKTFDMVINNDHEKLEIALLNKQIDFLAINRKNEFLIPTSIKYRSIECFELLINALPDDTYTIVNSGFLQALEYYSNAPNAKNKYFIEKLQSVNIDINNHIWMFTKNINIFNQFSQYILNENAVQYLNDCKMDITVYEAIFNYCSDNNLLTHYILSNIIEISFKSDRTDIIEIIKNTKYGNDIFHYCSNIFNYEMPNSVLNFFVQLYNNQKPTNIDVKKIVKCTIDNHIFITTYGTYRPTSTKNKFDSIIHNIDILLQLDFNDFNSPYINETICNLIVAPWTHTYVSSWIYRLKCENTMRFFIMLFLRFIEKSPSFVLNLSKIEPKYFEYISDNKSPVLKKGLKTLTKELEKLKKPIPPELYFLVNDNTIETFDILKKKKINH